MVGLYFELPTVGPSIFILSVVMMTISLSLALWEISISRGTLKLLLAQLEPDR